VDVFLPLPAELADPVEAARPRFGAHVSEVRYYATVTSTMDAATALAGAGAPHGLVVVAGHQSAGRGRRGHQWSSPPGAGLYFSTVVRPPLQPMIEGEPSVLGLITLTAGLAVAEGIGHATGVEASLKWPNDLFHGYKFAGVLAEGHEVGSAGQYVVLGAGINVRDVPYLSGGAVRTTSIEAEAGRRVDMGQVLAEVLAAWAMRYQDLLDGRYARVVERWRVRATGLRGRPVAWMDPSGEREGTTTGVDQTGALLVDTGTEVVRLTGGVVRWQ
jgi:BirA family biotin operon repressor/biotin-[acetyl-CoA-carboxylase] ligase